MAGAAGSDGLNIHATAKLVNLISWPSSLPSSFTPQPPTITPRITDTSFNTRYIRYPLRRGYDIPAVTLSFT